MENFKCPSMRPSIYNKLRMTVKPGLDRRQVPVKDPKPMYPTRALKVTGDPRTPADWDLRAPIRGNRCCIAYNKGLPCSRKLSGDTCGDASIFKYVHLCCKKTQNGICGKAHPAIKHI